MPGLSLPVLPPLGRQVTVPCLLGLFPHLHREVVDWLVSGEAKLLGASRLLGLCSVCGTCRLLFMSRKGTVRFPLDSPHWARVALPRRTESLLSQLGCDVKPRVLCW